MKSFDIDKYNSRECQVHNHGFYLGEQSKQAEVDELRKKIDDLTELNRLKTIALQQSVNRTSIHVHEKIVALEIKLKGDQS